MSDYELKIDLNVLNHLGINLYSNVPAVLSELIANAWDADSKEVKVTASPEMIKIEDDGCGMDAKDLNDKFLNVGYQRRITVDDDLTPELQRKVMGRKGIGKLSIFSVAKHIEVYTKKENTIGISMDVNEIRNSIEKKCAYHPEELVIDKNNAIKKSSGTTIILKNIKIRVASSIDGNLKKRVARRFDIWSDEFSVFINNEKITIEDRSYFHKVEFATVYGDYPVEKFTNVAKDKLRKRESKILEENNSIYGWIGFVKKSGGLQEGSDNLNKITVLARGKVALEDILELYREGGLYTKFLIGEIRADFLDLTEEDDIATSSRQNFIQNDERFAKLKEFIFKELKYAQRERAKYKGEEGAKDAAEIPAIREWLDTLRGDTKNAAKKWLGRVNALAVDEDHKKTLYKSAVLTFEYLRHKEKLQQLDNLETDNLEIIIKLFSDLDDLEASLYYQITEGRLKVIKKLSKHIKNNDLEKVVQQLIYDHLWLLDPSWDRATEHPAMEESIKDKLGKLTLSNEEKKGRFDIRYKKVSGRHVIIELKRSSVNLTLGGLLDQVGKYQSAAEKELKAYKENGSVEVICLVGSGLLGWSDLKIRQADEGTLATRYISVITYQELIKNAEASYQDYLNKSEEIGRIYKLLTSIDASPDSNPDLTPPPS